MITQSKNILLAACFTIFSLSFIGAQNIDLKKNKKKYEKLVFYTFRGTNAFDVALGTSLIDGDFQNPKYEIYVRGGYKRYLTDHLNIGISYSKYNLAYEDSFNEGFMSFDLNIEFLFSPYKRFSPFVYVGGGYNASNYFETTSTKAQGGFGLEYIVVDGFGLKVFGEYNYDFGDELDGLILGESNVSFYRVGFGFNLYFGGEKQKQKRLSKIETVIKSNPILPNN